MPYLSDAELVERHLPGDVAERSTPAERQAWIEAASAQADGYLRRAGYTLPLASVTEDLKSAVGQIAAYNLAVKLGLLPEPAAQSALYLGHKAAVEWLKGVGNGSVTLLVEGAEPGETPNAAPLVATQPRRDW